MEGDIKKTLVLGASTNPARYSHKAIMMLLDHGYPVIPVGKRVGAVEGIDIVREPPEQEEIHTVTLYLNQNRQKEYYDYILNLRPHRLIFNPGAENKELKTLAEQQGIETVEGCTLVMLSTNTF